MDVGSLRDLDRVAEAVAVVVWIDEVRAAVAVHVRDAFARIGVRRLAAVGAAVGQELRHVLGREAADHHLEEAHGGRRARIARECRREARRERVARRIRAFARRAELHGEDAVRERHGRDALLVDERAPGDRVEDAQRETDAARARLAEFVEEQALVRKGGGDRRRRSRREARRRGSLGGAWRPPVRGGAHPIIETALTGVESGRQHPLGRPQRNSGPCSQRSSTVSATPIAIASGGSSRRPRRVERPVNGKKGVAACHAG